MIRDGLVPPPDYLSEYRLVTSVIRRTDGAGADTGRMLAAERVSSQQRAYCEGGSRMATEFRRTVMVARFLTRNGAARWSGISITASIPCLARRRGRRRLTTASGQGGGTQGGSAARRYLPILSRTPRLGNPSASCGDRGGGGNREGGLLILPNLAPWSASPGVAIFSPHHHLGLSDFQSPLPRDNLRAALRHV
jgi:hypothetical protein